MVFLSMYCVFISKRGHKKQENVKKKKKQVGVGNWVMESVRMVFEPWDEINILVYVSWKKIIDT